MTILIRLFALFLWCSSAHAAIEAITFSSPDLEQRYQALSEELRCLVCQNQSLADSDASLAGDLRQILHEQLEQGRSDDEIIAFLVERYGEFVHYKPEFSGSTVFLWLAPGLFILLGGGFWFARFLNRRRTGG